MSQTSGSCCWVESSSCRIGQTAWRVDSGWIFLAQSSPCQGTLCSSQTSCHHSHRKRNKQTENRKSRWLFLQSTPRISFSSLHCGHSAQTPLTPHSPSVPPISTACPKTYLGFSCFLSPWLLKPGLSHTIFSPDYSSLFLTGLPGLRLSPPHTHTHTCPHTQRHKNLTLKQSLVLGYLW